MREGYMRTVHLTLYDANDLPRLLQIVRDGHAFIDLEMCKGPKVSDHCVENIEDAVAKANQEMEGWETIWKALDTRQKRLLEHLVDDGYDIICLYNDVGGITKPFLYRRYTEPKNPKIKITEDDLDLFKKQGLLTTKDRKVDEEHHSPVMTYKIYEAGWLASEILDMQLGSRMDRYGERHPDSPRNKRRKGRNEHSTE